MKHITILLAFLIVGITNIYSQGSTGEYNDLTAKLDKSNKALENPKKSGDPKFWLERANLFMDIAGVNTSLLRQGQSQNEVILLCKEPKEKKKTADDGEEYIYERFIVIFKNAKVDAWKETKNIVPNPTDDAISCINKAIELDTEKKSDKKASAN